MPAANAISRPIPTVRRRYNDLVAVLRQLKAADLYLACAAAHGRPGAEAAFERTLLARVAHFVGSVDSSPAFVTEVTQALRIKLLVGSDGQGKLAQHSGRAGSSARPAAERRRARALGQRPSGR
jgi:hypothetical protein